jgi:hypothetical protein
MYEDAWYNFVPEVAKKPATGGDIQRPGHRRKESLLQQPNVRHDLSFPAASHPTFDS